MKSKISIESQISAVETAQRNADKLHHNKAHTDLLARQLEEAVRSLRFLKQHRPTIIEATREARRG
ncbi:MAG: hypothetical protein OXR62_11020 [Ahrensia sp.]|nr:hypothetical protein [Ahrensia sp.]